MGWSEWLIILVVAALLFRPRQFGRAVGGMASAAGDRARPDAGRHPPGATLAARTERARLLSVLELPPDATAAQIRRAWRELAKVWHPDRFGHDPALQARATSRLAAINAAYAQLKDAPATT